LLYEHIINLYLSAKNTSSHKFASDFVATLVM
jgi:hypothetical protein